MCTDEGVHPGSVAEFTADGSGNLAGADEHQRSASRGSRSYVLAANRDLIRLDLPTHAK